MTTGDTQTMTTIGVEVIDGAGSNVCCVGRLGI